MITTELTYSSHWEILVLFYLQKKIPENTILTVTVNYSRTEKQIMVFKTTLNWLFNDI